MTLVHDNAAADDTNFGWGIAFFKPPNSADSFVLGSYVDNSILGINLTGNTLEGTFTVPTFEGIDDYVEFMPVSEDNLYIALSGNVKDIIVLGACNFAS
jgi:hypothetical protein